MNRDGFGIELTLSRKIERVLTCLDERPKSTRIIKLAIYRSELNQYELSLAGNEANLRENNISSGDIRHTCV